MEEILRATVAELDAGRPCVLVTVIETLGHSPARVGSKLLVREEGPPLGTVGGGALEQLCTERAQALLAAGESVAVRYSLDGAETADDRDRQAVATSMICGGEATLFFNVIARPPSLYIFGAGHIGRALAYHLAPLGFRIHVRDGRPEFLETFPEHPRLERELLPSPPCARDIAPGAFAVVATHSHEVDYGLLRDLLALDEPPRYIGVVGSRRKRTSFLARLEADLPGGFDRARLFIPCGLSVASRDPQGIAIAVAAEILALREGRDRVTHMREA